MPKNEARREFLKTTSWLAGGVALSRLPMGAYAQGQNTKRPNILFFFPDQHRYDWVGTNPQVPVRTPCLDAMGNRGVRFSNAVCPSPLCAPSRACLAAGVEYSRCGVRNNQVDFPTDRQTFYHLLRDSGYQVMGCGKFDLNKKSKIRGIDGKEKLHLWGFSDGIDSAGKWDGVSRGLENISEPYLAYLDSRGLAKPHIDDFERRRGGKENRQYTVTEPTALPDDAYCDNWVAAKGLDLIAHSPNEKPWFLQVNFPGPHPPVDITRSMEQSVRGRTHPQPNRNTEFPPETHNLIRQNYSAMIENIDQWLGIYLDELEKRGELENTLIVFSSDHGEMLGDHDLWGKTKPHQPSVGVPLAIAGPGVVPQEESKALVSVMDLASTFLEAAGVETPEEMDSRSLGSVLRCEKKSHRDVLFSGLEGWREVRDSQYKLVVGWPEEESTLLFDLLEDPLENRNLAQENLGKVKELEEVLKEV